MKALIVAGDRDILAEVLGQIFDADLLLNSKLEEKTQGTKKRKIKNAKIGPDKALFIDSVDDQKNLTSTQICLEYLLVAISRNF